jgi:hypothetical protein
VGIVLVTTVRAEFAGGVETSRLTSTKARNVSIFAIFGNRVAEVELSILSHLE